MLANWVKQAVSAGGTGNLTLGSADSGHLTLDTAVGQGPRFVYSIEDGSDREIGIGYLSASTTLVRSTVLETLASGTLDRTSPSALDVTTAAKVMIAGSAHNMMGAYIEAPYPAAIEGICSMGQVDETGVTVTSHAGAVCAMPFWWPASKMVSQATIYVGTAAAGATARIGIYSISSTGKPAILLKEFTDAATMDCSTTGAKVATPSAPVWLPAGFYYLGFQASSASVGVKASQYSPSGLFLGASSSGARHTGLYRYASYGALAADETSSTWEINASVKMTAWLK